MTGVERVREFHTTFKQAQNLDIEYSLMLLRMRLINEEYKEFTDECNIILDEWLEYGKITDELKAKLLKEMADLKYVINGLAVTFGLPLDEAEEEVHKSNMSKLGKDGLPIYREDGKVLKGPNYKEADILSLFKKD